MTTRIDFQNINDDGSNTEYIGARIASRNPQSQNEGNLEFFTRRLSSLEKRFEINQIAQLEFHTTVKYNNRVVSSIWPVDDATDRLGLSGQRWLHVWAFNPIIQTSDIRDKTEIEDIDYGLKDILDLRPVSYKWKERTYEDPQLGLIAQEVQHIIPEVVVDKDYQVDKDSGVKLSMRKQQILPI